MYSICLSPPIKCSVHFLNALYVSPTSFLPFPLISSSTSFLSTCTCDGWPQSLLKCHTEFCFPVHDGILATVSTNCVTSGVLSSVSKLECSFFLFNLFSSQLIEQKLWSFLLLFFKRLFIYLFIDRREGREKERKRNNVWLPLMHPQLGTWPATQACALTGNRTSDPLLLRLVLNPLNHTCQGQSFLFVTPVEISQIFLNYQQRTLLEVGREPRIVFQIYKFKGFSFCHNHGLFPLNLAPLCSHYLLSSENLSLLSKGPPPPQASLFHRRPHRWPSPKCT